MTSHGAPTDPYRLFFPLGIAIGIAGVAIWPVYYFGLSPDYSGRSHAFVQSTGFVYAFVVGFLLTAIPRFTNTEGPGRAIQFVLAAMLLISSAAFELRIERIGHVVFLLTHCLLLYLVAVRFVHRRNPPPATFPLIGIGLLTGALGAVINAGIAWGVFDPKLDLLGKRSLTEGMILLLVLGVGGFLGPRLLGFRQIPDFQKVGALSDETGLSWLERHETAIFVLIGFVMVATLVAEYVFMLRPAAYVRTIIATAIIAIKIRPWQPPAVRSTLAWCVWLSFLFLTIGLWVSVVAPAYRVEFLHIVFIGGFTLLILSVGMRVTLSHGGHSIAAEKRSWPLRIGITAVIIAMMARAGATFAPNSFFEHLAIAALLWIAALAVWGYYLIRLLQSDQTKP